jgi:adenosylmethionine---8-amino-7-oxononanoate aminotransferase
MPSSHDPRDHIWFPFTHTDDLKEFPPIVMERGDGVYLHDTAGKAYIDAISSWWVNTLGHNNPRINAAVKEQVDRLEHVLMAGCVAPPTLRLAGLLASILPEQLTKIFFSDDGSTAVEVALKVALQYWDRKGMDRSEFVSLGGGYHGDTLGAVSVSGSPQLHTLFHRAFRQHHCAMSPYCYRCPVGKRSDTCRAECMDSLEEILNNCGERIAACIVEPMVQAAAGFRVYPPKVLSRIAGLCRSHDVLLIADEVAMGFGRTGEMFACQHAGVVPDILCLAKGLTGGYIPLAATVVTDEIYQHFCGSHLSDATLNHGHSFTGNPLASAAACAALGIMIEQDLPHGIRPLQEHFQRRLQDFAGHAFVGDVRGIGMVGAIELVADRGTKAPFPIEARTAFRIARRATDRGVLLRPLGNVLYFIPPYVITTQQIDTIFSVTREAIGDVLGA